MNRLLGLLPLLCLLTMGVMPTRPVEPIPPAPLDCYQVAALVTGAPAAILQGIARAESGERDEATGDGGESIGRFQLREIYHAERAAKWGEYDPRNEYQAAIIAGRIYQDNLARLGDEDLAIAAYRQGVRGVRENGATGWYIERVREIGE